MRRKGSCFQSRPVLPLLTDTAVSANGMAAVMALDDIREAFSFFDDWEDRYRYVVDLGKQLPSMPDALKTDATKVQGCQSQVWLVARPALRNGQAVVEYLADSDAHIVRGLVAILLAIYSGRPATEIAATDSRAMFAELGLDQHLSPSRANGLFSMDRRIKELAHAMATASG